MSNWLDLSNNANTVKSTYIQGFLDVSGNAEINQNISTNHYKSIRSITVDIGTNSSSSKTVSFSYGKTYSDISNLAFNVNVYSVGSSDNKPIDVTIYNYTTSGANLLVEASSTESDKTWSYSLSKSLLSGLPILYNNIGSFKEKIPAAINDKWDADEYANILLISSCISAAIPK